MSLRAAFLVASGKTQPITDSFFLMLGGGLDEAIGPVASMLLALAVSAWLLWRTWQRRRRQQAHGLAPRPLWFDVTATGLFCVAAIGFAAAMSTYRIGDRPQGQGIPVPVLIWAAVVVVVVVSFIVKRTRFGRYVLCDRRQPRGSAAHRHPRSPSKCCSSSCCCPWLSPWQPSSRSRG